MALPLRRYIVTLLLCAALLSGSIGCNRASPHFEGFTFSPDSTYLAGVYFRPGSAFLYKIPLDTGKAMRLTNATAGFEGAASFSPDGKQIAYSYSPSQDAPARIVITNVDGQGSSSWPPSESDDIGPLFSPDNRTIIFARSNYYGSYSPIARPAQHEWNFYVADLDGSHVRQLTNEKFYMVSRPSISPDGKTMLFVSSAQDGDVMVVYSLEQPPKPKLILRTGIGDRAGHSVLGDAMFMPDGNNIFFDAATTGARGYFDYDIYRMDLHTQKIDKLTNANGYSFGLQLSRDGKTAVFMRDASHWYRNQTDVLLLDLAARRLSHLKVIGLEQPRTR
jgi:Tol biopolymer transport system component